MDSYMCRAGGERCDETVTVRGPFGETEECLYCHYGGL